jgi:hypothetical protein
MKNQRANCGFPSTVSDKIYEEGLYKEWKKETSPAEIELRDSFVSRINEIYHEALDLNDAGRISLKTVFSIIAWPFALALSDCIPKKHRKKFLRKEVPKMMTVLRNRK